MGIQSIGIEYSDFRRVFGPLVVYSATWSLLDLETAIEL